MNDHYYTETPHAASEPIYWETQLKNKTFRFKTDRGVFSKNKIDFGSRLLIEEFAAGAPDGPILDVGCGYGPIGLTLATLFPNKIVHLVDVNKRALSLAKENAALNNLKNVDIYESDRLVNVNERNFSVIVSNPPIRAGKQVVHDIFTQAVERLRQKGELWIVIQKKQGAPSALKKLEELFEEVEVVTKKKGYFIIRAIKR